jgi:hypothetical protein
MDIKEAYASRFCNVVPLAYFIIYYKKSCLMVAEDINNNSIILAFYLALSRHRRLPATQVVEILRF